MKTEIAAAATSARPVARQPPGELECVTEPMRNVVSVCACVPQRTTSRGLYSDFVVPIRVFAHPKAVAQHASQSCRPAPNTGLGFRQSEHKMSIKKNLLAAVT